MTNPMGHFDKRLFGLTKWWEYVLVAPHAMQSVECTSMVMDDAHDAHTRIKENLQPAYLCKCKAADNAFHKLVEGGGTTAFYS